MLENPSTWKAIKDNYYIKIIDKDYLLLKKREKTQKSEAEKKIVYALKDNIIFTNESDEIRIIAELSFRGKLTKLLWKIPEVWAKIIYADNTIREGRVITENLSNGIVVNGLPYDYLTLSDAIETGGGKSKIKSIQLYGDGLQYYNDTLTLEYINYDSTTKDQRKSNE